MIARDPKNCTGWSMPLLLLILLLAGAIAIGAFFGMWWILAFLAAFLLIGIVSIIFRAVKDRKAPNNRKQCTDA